MTTIKCINPSKSPKQPSCLNRRRRRRMCFWRFVFWIFGGEDIFFFFYNLIVHNCVELFPSSACPFGARVDEAAGVRTKQEFWLLFAFVYARRTNYLFVWLKLFFVCAFLAKTCAFFLFHKAQFAWIYSLFRCVLGLAQNVRTIKPKTTSSSSHTIKVQSKIIICLIIRRFGHLFLLALPSTHRHCSRH